MPAPPRPPGSPLAVLAVAPGCPRVVRRRADRPVRRRRRARRSSDDPESVDAFDWLKAPAPVPKRPGGRADRRGPGPRPRVRGARGDAAGRRRQPDGRAAGRDGAVRCLPRAWSSSCPTSPAKRLAVFQLYAEQVRNDGYTPRADTGQKYLFFPWTRTSRASTRRPDPRRAAAMPRKYAIVIPDGAADEPQASLGGKTPLQAADTPEMDRIAREGVLGRSRNVPDRFLPGQRRGHAEPLRLRPRDVLHRPRPARSRRDGRRRSAPTTGPSAAT